MYLVDFVLDENAHQINAVIISYGPFGLRASPKFEAGAGNIKDTARASWMENFLPASTLQNALIRLVRNIIYLGAIMPFLPLELERLIFEMAALQDTDHDSRVQLILVAKRVYEWYARRYHADLSNTHIVNVGSDQFSTASQSLKNHPQPSETCETPK